MRQVWDLGSVAVTGEEIDFQDPAEVGPDVRERGLRLELRAARVPSGDGTIYASEGWALDPAFCRIDLLESAPGARDRIHWHPTMVGGEPEDRVFDAELSGDPAGWVRRFLADPLPALNRAGIDDRRAADEIRRVSAEIAGWVERGLERLSAPWPSVTHDERGLATP